MCGVHVCRVSVRKMFKMVTFQHNGMCVMYVCVVCCVSCVVCRAVFINYCPHCRHGWVTPTMTLLTTPLILSRRFCV